MNSTIGQRIRQAREAAGLLQGELATRIGIKQASLSDIESGESKAPSATTLLAMSDVLKVPPRWIMFGEDGELNIPTPKEHELLDRFRELGADQQAAILATLAALSKK